MKILKQIVMVLIVCTFGMAQQAKVGYYAVPAPQPDAPMQVVGVNETGNGMIGNPIVLTKNTLKTIKSYQLSAVTVIPASCNDNGVQISKMRLGRMRYYEMNVRVKKLTNSDIFYEPSEADMLQYHARYAITQVGVQRVNFVDGTSWIRQGDSIFDQSQIDKLSARCSLPLPVRPADFRIDDDFFKKKNLPSCWFFCEAIDAQVSCHSAYLACFMSSCGKSCNQCACTLYCT